MRRAMLMQRCQRRRRDMPVDSEHNEIHHAVGSRHSRTCGVRLILTLGGPCVIATLDGVRPTKSARTRSGSWGANIGRLETLEQRPRGSRQAVFGIPADTRHSDSPQSVIHSMSNQGRLSALKWERPTENPPRTRGRGLRALRAGRRLDFRHRRPVDIRSAGRQRFRGLDYA